MKDKPFDKTEPPHPTFCPEPTLGMRLSETDKRLHNCLRKACEAVGLPQSYRQFLFHLELGDGLTQQELANRVRLSPPTVSVTLQKMEREGLLLRQPDEKDQRTIRVFLTDAGHDVNQRIHDALFAVDSRLTEGFSAEEQALFSSMLQRMNENLEGMNL